MHTNPNNYSTQLKRIQAFFQSLRESEAAMRVSILLISFITTLIIISSCDNNPTGPEDPPPGRRDYVWEVDTIPGLLNNQYHNIHMKNYSEIWIVGSGQQNTSIIIHKGKGNIEFKSIPQFEPFSIWGDNNRILIGGSNREIYLYEGGSFKRQTGLSEDSLNWTKFVYDIKGNSQNTLYAVGGDIENTGFILKSEVDEWKTIYSLYPNTQFTKVVVNEKDVLISGFEFITGSKKRIFKLISGELQPIFCRSELTSYIDILNLGNEIVIRCDNDLYKYTNGNMKYILNLDSINFSSYVVFGRNINDLFGLSEDGIIQFNGEDVKLLLGIKDLFTIISYDISENSVCFLSIDNNRNYILIKGKY